MVFLNQKQSYCSCLFCNVRYFLFISQNVSKPFWNYLSLCSRRSWKKRQKFGDVVNDVFPSQWFFHALYKKTGRRDMRPPRSDFLWNWLTHMTQIVSQTETLTTRDEFELIFPELSQAKPSRAKPNFVIQLSSRPETTRWIRLFLFYFSENHFWKWQIYQNWRYSLD